MACKTVLIDMMYVYRLNNVPVVFRPVYVDKTSQDRLSITDIIFSALLTCFQTHLG